MAERDWKSQNEEIIGEFRASRGKVGGYFADKPLLVLTTIGARTGRPRTNPLGYLPEGNRYAVFASAVGGPRNPDWYHNLLANPGVIVEVGTTTFPATAVVTAGKQRRVLLDHYAALHPQWARYQTLTTRQFPVVLLIPKVQTG
jgi:deazaflavin-dependent oxidoreductase (nitroreductase family)